jgi:DNA polymerase-1
MSINWQNFPSRKAKYIRNIVEAPKGYVMVACDLGQIEARVIAMVSLDDVWIDQIWNDFDIHMHWTEELLDICPDYIDRYKGDIKDRKKDIRKLVKNSIVFPLFYGAGVPKISVLLNIDEDIGSELYSRFWEEYKIAKAWQNNLLEFYKTYGYIKSVFGRRRYGPMSINEILDTPIQSAATDIFIDSGNRLSRMAYELNKPQLQYRLSIHDDNVFFLPEETAEDDILIIVKEMVKPLFKFINVPLSTEVSVGYKWGELEEVTKFSSVDFYTHKNRIWEVEG